MKGEGERDGEKKYGSFSSLLFLPPPHRFLLLLLLLLLNLLSSVLPPHPLPSPLLSSKPFRFWRAASTKPPPEAELSLLATGAARVQSSSLGSSAPGLLPSGSRPATRGQTPPPREQGTRAEEAPRSMLRRRLAGEALLKGLEGEAGSGSRQRSEEWELDGPPWNGSEMGTRGGSFGRWKKKTKEERRRRRNGNSPPSLVLVFVGKIESVGGGTFEGAHSRERTPPPLVPLNLSPPRRIRVHPPRHRPQGRPRVPGRERVGPAA